LYVHKYNIETLNEDGSINPISHKWWASILIRQPKQSDLLQRLASGYRKHVKGAGGKVGRIRGVKMEKCSIVEKA
jgi:hypothetical protein